MKRKITRRVMAFLLVLCMIVSNFSGVYAASKKTVKTTSVKLNKSEITLEVKKSFTLKATVLPGNAMQKSLVWSSSNKNIAAVNNNGKVVAKKNGTATITVKVKGTDNSAKCKVKVITRVEKVSLNVKNFSLTVGKTKNIKATVSPGSASTKGVTYKSSNTKVATVDKNGKVVARKAGTATITATAKDGSKKKASVKITVIQPVTSIELKSDKTYMEVGESISLKTVVEPTNAKNKDVEYTSSNSEVATVDSTGKVTGLAVGTTEIRATAKDGSKVYGKISITVRASLADVTWNSSCKELTKIEAGKAESLGVEILPANAQLKSIDYVSSDEKIAKVTADGQLIGLSNGVVTIKAIVTDIYGNNKTIELKDITVHTSVTGLEIGYSETELNVSDTKNMEAVVLPETASNKEIRYVSDNEAVATVDENGLIKAVSKGVANISAISKENETIYKVCHVTVKVPVKNLFVYNSDIDLHVEENKNIVVTILPDTASNKGIRYVSDNEAVAKVDDNGLITGVSKGTANISVISEDNENISKVCHVTVKVPVKNIFMVNSDLVMNVDETKKVNVVVLPESADNKEIKYVSDNEAVATVDENGMVKAVSKGTAKIKAISKDNESISKVCHVTVKVPVKDIVVSAGQETLYETQSTVIKATVSNEDASDKTITFTSSNPEIATVDANGKVNAIKAGDVEITARANGAENIEKKVTIHVKAIMTGVAWNAGSDALTTVEADDTAQLGYVVSPANAEVKAEYASDNEEVATVSATGVVKAKKNGKAKITLVVTDGIGNVKKLEKDIAVKTSVTGINVNEKEKLLYVNEYMDEYQQFQLVCQVLPETASNKKIIYASDNEAVATVNESGLITAVNAGKAKITATTEDGKKTQTVEITVEKISTHMSVSTSEQLSKALKNTDLQVLTIKDAKELEIPEGNYENVSLIVDSPEGHIENHGTFKDIKIEAISDSTFVEYGDNSIDFSAKNGTINIAATSSAKVNVQEGAEALKLINNGKIESVVINTNVDIEISGSSNERINVVASEEAKDASINTEKNLDLKADVQIKLDLGAGAENTIVQVEEREQLPIVIGLGRVEVTISLTLEVESVVGDNTKNVTTQKTNVKGIVSSSQGLISGAEIYLIPYRAAITEKNIEEYIDDNTVKVTSDDEGNYETGEMAIGNYYLYVKKEGFRNVVTTLVITSNNNEAFYADMVWMIAGSENAVGSIHGLIVNSGTGEKVEEGISLRIREGVNNLSGQPLATTQTKEDGTYLFENLPIGQYTIQVIDVRENVDVKYMNSSFNVVVEEGENEAPKNSISKKIDEEQVRFVLTWGNERSGASKDLDAHLVGPNASGDGNFHIYSKNREYSIVDENNNSVNYAGLEANDASWEGPETATIYKKVKGKYKFYVHDYTNFINYTSKQLSMSQAVVKVYVGNRLAETFSVPNEPGTLWEVCEFDAESLEITPINKVSVWEFNEEDIGIDKVKQFTEHLIDEIEKLEIIKSCLKDESEISKVDDLIEEVKGILAEDSNLDTLVNESSKIHSIIFEYDLSATIWISYNTDTVDDVRFQREENNLEYGEILGYTEEIPELSIRTYMDTTTYSIEDSDKEEYDIKITVVAESGYKRMYYYRYRVSDRVLSIGSAHTEELQYGDYIYLDSSVETKTVGDKEIYVATITGFSIEFPDDLTIVPAFEKSVVSDVIESDIEGFDGMFTISHEGKSRTYYIIWQLSEYSTIVWDVTSEKRELSSWSTEKNETGGSYIYIYSDSLEVPDDLKISVLSSKATISDIISFGEDGKQKKIEVSIGEFSETYEIICKLSESATQIKSIEAMDGETNLITSYTTRKIDDDYYNFKELSIEGITPDMPENIVISSCLGDYKYEIVESDDIRYEKMAVLPGVYTNYYIVYKFTDIKHRVNWYGDGEEFSGYYGKETINDKTINVFYATGKSVTEPTSWEVSPIDPSAVVEIKDIPQEKGYEKFSKYISVTNYGSTMEYYLTYTLSSYLLQIENVTATDENGNEKIYNWNIETQFYSPDNSWSCLELNVLCLYGNVKDLPDDLKITSTIPEASVNIMDSDIEKYDKKIEISFSNSKNVYYIQYDSEKVVNITAVYGDDKFYSMGIGTIQDGEESINVINLVANKIEVPSEWRVDTEYSETEVSIVDSDRENYVKKVVLSINDIEKIYYLSYVISPDTLYVSRVVSGQGESMIEYQYKIVDRIIDEETKISYIDVDAKSISMPDDLLVECSVEGVKSEMLDSDREEYDKMVKFSAGDVEKIYYIKYTISASSLDIQNVSSLKDGVEQISLHYILYEQIDGVLYNELTIRGVLPSLPESTVISTKIKGLNYELKDSDVAKYDKKAVVKCGEYSREYYVVYKQDLTQYHMDLFGDGNRLNISYEEDTVNEKKINVIRVKGASTNEPKEWSVYPYYSTASAEIKDVPEEVGYEKYSKVVSITNNGITVDFYVLYEISPDAIKVSKIVSGQEKEEITYNFIEDYDKDNEINCIIVEAKTIKMPEDLRVECTSDEAKIEVLDSDREAYDKIVKFFVSDIEKTYYLKYEVNDSALKVGKITAQVDGVEQITSYFESFMHDDNGNEYQILNIVGNSPYIPDNLVIMSGVSELNYEIVDSDKAEYKKMAVIAYGEHSKKYYLKYEAMQSE